MPFGALVSTTNLSGRPYYRIPLSYCGFQTSELKSTPSTTDVEARNVITLDTREITPFEVSISPIKLPESQFLTFLLKGTKHVSWSTRDLNDTRETYVLT